MTTRKSEGVEQDPVVLASQILLAKKKAEGPAGEPAAADSVQEKLAQLLFNRLQKQAAQDEESEDQKAAARRQGQETQARREANQAMAQSACPHMKPWGGTAIAGQRDHGGVVIYICQYCTKVWRGSDVTKGGCPTHLLPPAERIGGPNVGI